MGSEVDDWLNCRDALQRLRNEPLPPSACFIIILANGHNLFLKSQLCDKNWKNLGVSEIGRGGVWPKAHVQVLLALC